MPLVIHHGLVFTLLLWACGSPLRSGPAPGGMTPQSEKTLAARKLQQPLQQHLCQTAVYQQQGGDWRVQESVPVTGRGPTFATALEALCREADGLHSDALADIRYQRPPSGWSAMHELRGTALRFQEGFSPPAPAGFETISPPQMPAAEEPAPAGETAP